MTGRRSPHVGAVRTEDDELLIRVAWYYYKDDLTQAEIAKRLSVSRATVARLLDRARDRGVVRIEISPERLSAFDLSRRVRDRFGLRDVLVVPPLEDSTRSTPAINARVAQGAAQYLDTAMRPGAVMGVGWGDTVARTLFEMHLDSLSGIKLVTLTGGVDAYLRAASATGIAGAIDELSVMPAPLLASSPEIATGLREEKSVREIIQRAEKADITLIGIGAVIPDASITHMGLQTADQLREYAAQGAVGDILGELYDDHGDPLELEVHRLRIGIPIARLRDMRLVVAAAGGKAKIPAILGALRGGYVDVLVTTQDVAEVLAEAPVAARRS